MREEKKKKQKVIGDNLNSIFKKMKQVEKLIKNDTDNKLLKIALQKKKNGRDHEPVRKHWMQNSIFFAHERVSLTLRLTPQRLRFD